MKFLTDFTLEHNLTQLVTFNTWSRTIKGVIKESLLDHVYVNNFAAVSNVTFTVPVFGDHVLVLIDLKTRPFTTNETVLKRNWSGYSPSLMNNNLLNKINNCSLNLDNLNVQEIWNTLDNLIIDVVDEIVPLKNYPACRTAKNEKIPTCIKQKLNKRNRLLKHKTDPRNLPQIKSLSKEIKDYFLGRKTSKVKMAAAGPKPDIWKAVKVAKDLCAGSIPTSLTLGGIPVRPGDIASSFANHFFDKVKLNISKAKVSATVYNGKCQLIVQNRNFMTPYDVQCCLTDMPNKKCEGFDRIPACTIYDSRAVLLKPSRPHRQVAFLDKPIFRRQLLMGLKSPTKYKQLRQIKFIMQPNKI